MAWVPSIEAQTTPAAPVSTSQPEPQSQPVVRWFARNLTRVESWRYFRPEPGGGDPRSVYIANRMQFGVERRRPRYDFTFAGQYVQFGGLPAKSSGPGALGTGALYFDHSGDSNSRQIYLRYLNVRLKGITRGLDLAVGRMPYTSGAESSSGDAAIEAVKRQRVDSRLIGEFEWSIYQRGFDGARVDLDRPKWHLTASALVPTQGGFEESANASLKRVSVLTGVLTLKPAAVFRRTDWQLFAYRYNDNRAVRARPDNTGLPAGAIDVQVNTFGTGLVGAYPSGGGRIDALLWLVGQTGSWYGQSHRANAVAAEFGYQWTGPAQRPWIRAGLFRSTGDKNPRDTRHTTFFQMLPTGRKYSLSTVYALMNLTDVFAQVMARPHPKLSVRIDLHRVALTQSADRWYGGSGATQSAGTMFGYAGRPSRGATSLGTVLEGAADCTITSRWSVNGYVGWIDGGDVVRGNFAGHSLTFAYVENVLQF